jgi:hypothetical protein
MKREHCGNFSVARPFEYHERFASKEMNSPFVLEGTYFGRQHVESVEERDGLRMQPGRVSKHARPPV